MDNDKITTQTTETETMTKITVKNDFHNREINLILKGDTLTQSQMRRVKNELCGSPDCKCGGIRGDQDFNYEHTLVRICGDEYETIEISNI
jgi:hypothetical protein